MTNNTKNKNFLAILKEKEIELLINNNVEIGFPKKIADLTADDLTPYPCVREDLRNLIIFPIDCDTTNDRDDALSISYDNGIFHLGVHIADVSAYVRHGSILEKVARERSTSIYSPTGKVIPMLPDILSQDLCSLNCKDRYAISTFIDINAKGKVINFTITKSVIHPTVLGVYSEVDAVLNGTAGQAIKAKYSTVYDSLLLLKRLATILRRNRRKNGANISVDTARPQIQIKNNQVLLSPPDDGIAHQIVEESMIISNSCTAKFFKDNNLMSVFRVQDDLKHNAYYCSDHTYHTSLAVDYAHCTSPIRRFPDLINQTILSAFLMGCPADALHYIFDSELEEVAELATKRYRRARDIQRSIEKFAYKEYLKNHKTAFRGKICGLNSGDGTVFIRLDKLNLCLATHYTAGAAAIGKQVFFKVNLSCAGSNYRAYDIRMAV